jgi:hypothetical protein
MAPSARGAGHARSFFFLPLAGVLAGAACALMGCAVPAAAAASAPSFDARVLVKLTRPSADAAAIAAEATRQAGVPVTYAASVSSDWHALYLHCPDAAACDAAMARMRQSGSYADVEPDARKRRAVM